MAHLTLPRAGTFIYHTHLNDLSQLTAGLYGPLVVLEPGTTFDPARDHIFTIAWDGEETDHLPIKVNGGTGEPPLEVEAGTEQRLRFINIGVAAPVWIQLRADSGLAQWRVVAVDGADLPPGQVREQPARRRLDVGMTFDALFTPAAGSYELQFPSGDSTFFYRRRIIVR